MKHVEHAVQRPRREGMPVTHLQAHVGMRKVENGAKKCPITLHLGQLLVSASN